MIKLHQFKDNLGVPNPSPFCMKVETYLRMAGLEYEVVLVLDPRKAPKGKAPHVEDDGKTIADSHFILDHLERKYHTGIDDHLSAQEKSIAHAFARMLEERFYWGLMYKPLGR